MPKLVEPSVEYTESVLATLREYAEQGLTDEYDNQQLAAIDFGRFVHDLQQRAVPGHQPAGTVPESYYWLIDESGQHVGDISIRHYLSERLLREGGHVSYTVRPSERRKGYGKLLLELGLRQASQLGLKRVLICCYESNPASIAMIERCGGRLADSITVAEKPERIQRYWINLL